MYLVDYHTHSRFSEDGSCEPVDMLLAARAAGLRELGISDHWDPPPRPHYYVEKVRDALKEAREAAPDMTLLHGVEVGDPHLNESWGRDALATPELDYIICSLHELSGSVKHSRDFYWVKYTDETQCHEFLRDYFEQNRALFAYGTFDIIGHIGYPLRYMARDGWIPSLKPHTQAIEKLFDDIIRHEVALEVNTSAMFGKLGVSNPDEEMLRLYYDRGGRLVTLGTDSHNAEHIGRGIRQTAEILKTIGFAHVTLFRNRERRLMPL